MFFEVKLLIYIPLQYVIVIINVGRTLGTGFFEGCGESVTQRGADSTQQCTHKHTHIMYDKRTPFILQFSKGSFLL